ncbi:DNA polymerase [Aureimonas ureilytica]|uniref:Type-4 uracil-DNA glycosylase n=1 Tax=Aureimonas ureilytica TaxID=401562 RepID=A0A175RQ66_9HYPH|nr:uracil-DNA glycosylase [Aureimonas ureilytica]KTR04939.1 DNA polymerase [Aureimonas ureilytica]
MGEALSALLDWYARAGIQSFVGEAPRDRFAETEAETERRKGSRPASGPAAAQTAASPGTFPERRSTVLAPPPRPAPAIALRSDEALATEAREQAARAGSLAELQVLLADFTGCGLKATAKNLVFGNGSETADLMFVGEAPGRDEDLAGEPFVGRSGQLLDRMLGSIGLKREDVRVTNTVPWRPPGNRTPTPAETETCLPFTLRHIELVNPRVLVCLGSPSAKALLRTDEGIMRLRGRWSSVTLPNGAALPTMAMLHPAYLLRQPSQKRLAWRDLLTLKQALDAKG